MHDAGTHARHFEHLVVADGVHLAGVGNDSRVGGVDAVHVGVNLALDFVAGEFHGCGNGDGRGVRPAAAQRRDVVLIVDALETGKHGNVARFKCRLQARGVDVADAGLAVRAVRLNADLRAGEADGFFAEFVDGHRGEGDGDLLAGGEEHVHFARRGRGRDLGSFGNEVVRGAALSGDDDDDLIAGMFGADGFAGGLAHPIRIA